MVKGKKKKFPWKMRFLKIPGHLLQEAKSLGTSHVMVACAKTIGESEVKDGLYSHLGITVAGGELKAPASLVPEASTGPFSARNIDGAEIVRKDLPKEDRSYSWEVPNWGDWSNGSHTQTRDYKGYPREFVSPKELEISIEVAKTFDNPRRFVVKFVVEQVLDINAKDFDRNFLENINLLQENVGAVSVVPSTATLQDYLATVTLSWEILPPGDVGTVVQSIVKGSKLSQEKHALLQERVQMLQTLKPDAFVRGTSGFVRYFGAKFAENLVAFENLAYGNALYVMFENWEALSKRSRHELLSGSPEGFHRIEHRSGWKSELREVVNSRRPKTPKR